jgi:serine/threonine protein kinase
MALLAGTRLGPYEILGLIGAGGMGEVYRAVDTKLKREVAIKVLPPAVISNPERLARFEREGEVLASLNHPNIASIHGVEDADGIRALIMELVDGPTLADRLAGGPLPQAESLEIAGQIAGALESAHERGIIHRDLKPANIKIRADGSVKVLDFGLAKVLVPGAVADISGSTTLSAPIATRPGVILGTAAYLSPEQAKGQAVDARTDVWALGCVLYEMLTGRPAFARATITETLAQLLDFDPDWDALPANTPWPVRRLLQRCLRKDPQRRLHAAADVRIAIEDALTGEDVAPSAARRPVTRNGTLVPWFIAGVAGTAAVAIAIWTFTAGRASVVPKLQLDVTTFPTADPASFALSPDGQSIVYVALNAETPQLFLRRLDQTDAYALAATEGASYPFWSPDSRSIAFFAGGWLKRLDMSGGRPEPLAQARNGKGGAWSRDDVIIYAPFAACPLMRVPAGGGAPRAVTRMDPGELSHRFPAFLPDGRRFLFFVNAREPKEEGLYLASTDTPGSRHLLMKAESAAEYSPAGYLMMLREGVLVAVPFDERSEHLGADSLNLAARVPSEQGRAALSVSANGLVAYRTAEETSSMAEMTWIDRNGNSVARVPVHGFVGLSFDGRHAAVVQRSSARASLDQSIWLVDLPGGVPRRFTFERAFEVNPVWTPDGQRIIFASNRSGVYDLFEKPVNFVHDEQLVFQSLENKFPTDVSPDGRVVLFVNEGPTTGDDLYTVTVEEPRRPVRVLAGTSSENQGQFSPDGRWLAYRSNESGQWEIYVRPYPGPGSQQLVSRGGGIQPRWRRDGRELFYIALDGRLTAVSIRLPSQGTFVELGTTVPLFSVHVADASNQQYGYAVDPNGQRFLVNRVLGKANTRPITIVQNWMANMGK